MHIRHTSSEKHLSRRGVITHEAFTITELLVVIAVIAVVLSIILPALASARASAGRAKSLANIRTIVQSFHDYAAMFETYPFGNRGWVGPNLTPPNDFGSQDGYRLGSTYVGMGLRWPILMHLVADWHQHSEAWLSPGRNESTPLGKNPLLAVGTGSTRSPVAWSDYHYSHCFMGPPRAWDPDRTSAGGLAPRPTRPGQVRFPSKKVIIHDYSRLYLNKDPGPGTPRPVGFTDGSAKTVLDRDAAAPVKSVLSQFVLDEGGFRTSPMVYHDTPMGVDGADF